VGSYYLKHASIVSLKSKLNVMYVEIHGKLLGIAFSKVTFVLVNVLKSKE
jgi:hypothetical protein